MVGIGVSAYYIMSMHVSRHNKVNLCFIKDRHKEFRQLFYCVSLGRVIIPGKNWRNVHKHNSVPRPAKALAFNLLFEPASLLSAVVVETVYSTVDRVGIGLILTRIEDNDCRLAIIKDIIEEMSKEPKKKKK